MQEEPISTQNGCSIALFCCHFDYHIAQIVSEPGKRNYSQQNYKEGKKIRNKQRRSLKHANSSLKLGTSYNSSYNQSKQQSQVKIQEYGDFSELDSMMAIRVSNSKNGQNPNDKTIINNRSSLKKGCINEPSKIKRVHRQSDKKYIYRQQKQNYPSNLNSSQQINQFTLNQLAYQQQQRRIQRQNQQKHRQKERLGCKQASKYFNPESINQYWGNHIKGVEPRSQKITIGKMESQYEVVNIKQNLIPRQYNEIQSKIRQYTNNQSSIPSFMRTSALKKSSMVNSGMDKKSSNMFKSTNQDSRAFGEEYNNKRVIFDQSYSRHGENSSANNSESFHKMFEHNGLQ